jgi:AcrR family transcriptional regulator
LIKTTFDTLDDMKDDNTRQRIIDATERLFAELGEEGTSLRAITREAGVNVASIHYHFGGKDALAEAVLDRYVGSLNARRLDLLDDLRSAGAPTLKALVAAFVRPDLELIEELRTSGRTRFAQFLGAAYGQPSPLVAALIRRQFEPVARVFLPEFARTLADLDQDELQTRIGLLVSVITGLFAAADAEAPPLGTPDVDTQVARLTSFLTGGLRAPTTHPLPHLTQESR